MNKKMLFFGAALAALATFTGCTSDDEIANTTPQEPVPFRVSVTENDVTRASATTGENFSTFYLYSFQLNASSVNDALWMKNVAFTKPSTGTTWTGTGTWPASGGNSLFFASNMNVDTYTSSDGTAAITKLAIDGPDTSIGSYTCAPEGTGSTVRLAAQTIPNCWNSDAVNGGTDAVKDVVWATATNNGDGFASTDNNGEVKLTFNHTMARINFKFKLDFKGMAAAEDAENFDEEWWDDDRKDAEQGYGDKEYRVLIKSITLRNVKVTGSLNLVDGAWNATAGTNGAIRLEFPAGDDGQYFVIAANNDFVQGNATTYGTEEGGDEDANTNTITKTATGSMFIIPQDYTAATSSAPTGATFDAGPWTEPYFDIECICIIDNNRSSLTQNVGQGGCLVSAWQNNPSFDAEPKNAKGFGFGHMYIPLKKPTSMTNGFVQGKTYNFTINLGSAYKWTSSGWDTAWGFIVTAAN